MRVCNKEIHTFYFLFNFKYALKGWETLFYTMQFSAERFLMITQ